MKMALVPLLLALAGASLYGWGATVRRLAGAPAGPWPTTIGLGLAAVVALGGFVNVLRIAFAPTLWIILVSGLVLSASHLKRALFAHLKNLDETSGGLGLLLSGSVIAIAAAFTVVTQLPPSAFNVHDDFQVYFAFPVRMLATGTLLGSPLSSLGSVTMGGEAFLHGFVLSVFQISYINGVDAVFGLLLLMILAAAAGRGRLSPIPGEVLGPLGILAINPQYVNISALFIGAALMATAVMLVADDRETAALPPPLALGLVFAALIAIKLTFTLFVVLFLPLSALAVAGRTSSWRAGVAWASQAGLFTALGLAPWVVTHLPNYVHATARTSDFVPKAPIALNLYLLSVKPLFYGASLANYTAVAGVAATAAVLAAISVRRVIEKKHRVTAYGVVAGAATAVLAYLIQVVVIGPVLVGDEASLRYVIPILLGSAVIPVLLAGRLPSRLPRRVHIGLLALALVSASAAFYPSFIARCRQALNSGNVLAFSNWAQDPVYLAYNAAMLSDTQKQFIRRIQANVPTGEPLLAWINTPFWLDYKRNPIHDVEPAGLGTRWARITPDIRYVLWRYKGYATVSIREYETWMKSKSAGRQEPLITTRLLEFMQQIEQMRRTAKVLYDDGQYVLFEISASEGS